MGNLAGKALLDENALGTCGCKKTRAKAKGLRGGIGGLG